MASSTFIQLSNYVLCEYVYGDSTTTYNTSTVKLARITNDYLGSVQFLNNSSAENTTHNVLDTSAANLGTSEWAYLDKDVVVPYISQDSKIVYEDLSAVITGINVVYDTVRFHLQSGYTFDDIEGLIFQVYVKENGGGIAHLCNNVFLKGESREVFNPNPIFVTEKVYDKYVEILVPSTKEVNRDFYANPTNTLSLGYQFSSDNLAFLYDTQIYVKMYEISSTVRRSSVLFLRTLDSYEVNVRQEDFYSSLVAVIEESTEGDFFEYYPTYAGNFVEDFIADLNRQGGNYAVVHQINVIEQTGLDYTTTFSFTQVQYSGFDGPLYFRPILKYAGSATSFSLEYTMRVYNRDNGYQIMRTASLTSYNPRKYGKVLSKIALAEQSYPLKVYNKVYGGASITNPTPVTNSQFNTVYVPVFYESRNLYLGNKSILAVGQSPVDPHFGVDSIFFGQGSARIYVGDYESYVKFSVKQLNTVTGALGNLDLTMMTLTLSFDDTNGRKFSYPALASTVENSLADGEVVFRIPSEAKKRMGLSDGIIKNFYLTARVSESQESLLYTGTVDIDTNTGNENARVTALGSQAISIESLQGSVSTPTTLAEDIAAGTPVSSQLNLSNTVADNSGVNNVLPPSIPGFSTDSNAQDITQITPIS
jgi:hypothetical protein